MKNKKNIVRRIFQYSTSITIALWLGCFLLGYSTRQTEAVFRFGLIAIVFLSFSTIFATKRWWQRAMWIVVFLIFLIILVFWVGWDRAQFQF